MWRPHKYKARCCGDIIWSPKPGAWRPCECGESFVDETEHYGRLGGEVMPELLGEVTDEEMRGKPAGTYNEKYQKK